MKILDYFKKLAGGEPGQATTLVAKFEKIIDSAHRDLKSNEMNWWSMKPNKIKAFEDVLVLSADEKFNFITYAVKKVSSYYKNHKSYSSNDVNFIKTKILEHFMQYLLKTKLEGEDYHYIHLLQQISNNKKNYYSNIFSWPLQLIVNQITKHVDKQGLSAELKLSVELLHTKIKEDQHYNQKEKYKILEKLESILFQADNNDNYIKPVYFEGDDFGNYANELINNLAPQAQQIWFKFITHALKANGGKPSKKYLTDAKALMDDCGAEHFKNMINNWFNFLYTYKETLTEHTHTWGGRTYNYTSHEFVSGVNLNIIKGFIWMCVHLPDKNLLYDIAKLAERSYRKIPGKGPAMASVGNACLYVLANVAGLEGINHLSRLKLRIKQSNTQKLIEKYLLEAATTLNMTTAEIEDLAVDDYGLVNGSLTYEFDDYKAVLNIISVGKTEIQWFKPDGTPQKSVPAFVKEKYADQLKALKNIAKQIELTHSAQRDRLDREMKIARPLTLEYFHQFYFHHGLMSVITKKLIWQFEYHNYKKEGIWFSNQWTDVNGMPLELPESGVKVQLWHPVHASVETIRQWRDFLLQHTVSQPLKQAFREVYLLTDAEINTRTYSNRMAAHLLKQHQFNSLAKTRGWKYSLLGAYDDGRDNEIASITVPDYKIRAEFWINEMNQDDAMNDTGIWLYVATDQVRFINTTNNEVIDLVNVDPLLFSEIMRDVDLFVGVASVGNDPAWRDSGGVREYRDYWQSYSFGNLTELAKTRKEI